MSPLQEPLAAGKGICHVLFAYDVGLAINLEDAGRRITSIKERGGIRPKRRAPCYFEFTPEPLRVIEEVAPLRVRGFETSPGAEITLFDFGALSVAYRIPIENSFPALLNLSDELYENAVLLADSRRRVEHLLAAIQDAVDRPAVSDAVEYYVIFQIDSPELAGGNPICSGRDVELAQILRCERGPLSEDEVRDAISCRISFRDNDLTVIDWHAAALFGQDLDDVRAVLEYANVELLEMRILDRQLDIALDEAYELLSRKRRPFMLLPGLVQPGLTRIAQLQVDGAVLFERVANTLKLLGDQYLARVYRLASQRFHLQDWDSGILRKLQTLDSIYIKMADRAATRRMEILEWIIIVLIAVSIFVSF